MTAREGRAEGDFEWPEVYSQFVYCILDAFANAKDPGAERVHYDPEFDVRDLVSLSDVMNEYDLGPNGAQILAADLVADFQILFCAV